MVAFIEDCKAKMVWKNGGQYNGSQKITQSTPQFFIIIQIPLQSFPDSAKKFIRNWNSKSVDLNIYLQG